MLTSSWCQIRLPPPSRPDWCRESSGSPGSGGDCGGARRAGASGQLDRWNGLSHLLVQVHHLAVLGPAEMCLQPILTGAHHLTQLTVQVGASRSGRDLLLRQLLLVVLPLQVSLVRLTPTHILTNLTVATQ